MYPFTWSVLYWLFHWTPYLFRHLQSLLVSLPLLLHYLLRITYFLLPAWFVAQWLCYEIALGAQLAVYCASYFGYHSPPFQIPDLSRARLCHPARNVFIRGLRHTFLLRVPIGATTSWLIRELERRHEVLPFKHHARLDYQLLLLPGSGGRIRPLHHLFDRPLLDAGLDNNCTIEIRHYLPGGARDAECTFKICI